MPEQVSVAMAEIAGAMREGLLALAVGAGTGGEARRDPAPVADRAGSAPELADDFVGAAAIADSERAVVEAGEPALVSVSAGRRRRSCQRPREGSRDPRRAGRSAQCRSSGRRRRGRGPSCRGRAAPPRPACRPARTCPTCRTPAGRRPGRAPRRSACGGVGRKGLRDVLRQVLPLPGHGGAPGRPAHAGTAGATRAGRGGRARRPTRRLQDGGDPLDQPVPVADVGAGCPPARRGPAPRRRRAAHLRDGPRDRQAGCLLHAGSCQPAGGSARTSTPPRTRSKEFWIDRDTTVLHHDVRAETCGDSSWPLCALGTPKTSPRPSLEILRLSPAPPGDPCGMAGSLARCRERSRGTADTWSRRPATAPSSSW
jgi:hypothetical protein